jgi:hypothetical protein
MIDDNRELEFLLFRECFPAAPGEEIRRAVLFCPAFRRGK